MTTTKVTYTITATDMFFGYAMVPVLWRSAFSGSGSGYTLSWSIEDPSTGDTLKFEPGCVHTLSNDGFTASVNFPYPSDVHEGDQLIIHAMATEVGG